MNKIVQESSAVEAPIYRPLIGLQEDEIKELARKAWPYDETEPHEISEIDHYRITRQIAKPTGLLAICSV